MESTGRFHQEPESSAPSAHSSASLTLPRVSYLPRNIWSRSSKICMRVVFIRTLRSCKSSSKTRSSSRLRSVTGKPSSSSLVNWKLVVRRGKKSMVRQRPCLVNLKTLLCSQMLFQKHLRHQQQSTNTSPRSSRRRTMKRNSQACVSRRRRTLRCPRTQTRGLSFCRT